ncbi:hypothetical protein [Nonomuraea insulae]|uniref:Uncharacterized protein n=1 Tax=Nonomuraea insulae TaxID=1616787 RepID=A0ABW1DDE7_9ACTN
MSKAITALGGGLLVIAAMPAAAQAAGWRATYQDGAVTVPADRSSIKVCDGRNDGRVYKAQWGNDARVQVSGVMEVRAPQGACATDSSFLGNVMVFKICWGRLGGDKRVIWERCGAPQWVTAKPDWWGKK